MAVNKLGIVTDAATSLHNRHSQAEKKLAETIKQDKNISVSFKNHPVVSANDVTGVAYAGGDAKTVPIIIDQEHFELRTIGAKTIKSPVWTSTGLDVSLDLTDDEGAELTNGIASVCKGAWTVGQQKLIAKASVTVADVSGTDDCAFGWRKAEAYQAAIDNYDEMACLNIISGDIKAETIINNAATSTSSALSTLSDGGTVELKLIVNIDGSVEFYIDDVKKSVTFSFDSGEVIVPFFYYLHATTSPGLIKLSNWVVGKF